MTITQPFADAPAATEERSTSRASTVAAGVRDGIIRHRQELLILLGTVVFVIVMGLLGKAMVTA